MVGQLGADLASFCFHLQPQPCVYYAPDHNRYGDTTLLDTIASGSAGLWD
jgi:hypothetical protein